MGDVVRTTNEPQLGEIRLAWWRERLEELDEGRPAPAEPRLQAAERELIPKGIPGSNLGGQTWAWQRLLEPFPWDENIASVIAFRGQILFLHGALIIAGQRQPIEVGGDVWALVDAARHCSDADSRQLLLDQARSLARELNGQTIPAEFRPLSMLTALAIRDLKRGEPFEREGAPARQAAMLRHRLTGRI